MARKKLGIGSQSIQDFLNENMIYVDKTPQIYEMMGLGKHNFIVRPRRFGKSLVLDTIAAIYEGSKSQFEGTWIYDNIDWEAEKRPTLRIDFTGIEYNACSLEEGLVDYLGDLAETLNINIEHKTAKGLFRKIIETLAKEKTIVILIDEYEMPVTDFVGKDEQRLQENIDTLKKFYGVMKYASRSIHRSFITGVSKIGKIGVLSDLNMLNDLTLDERFATMFGYTETELRHFYAEYITDGAKKLGCTEEELLASIKQRYNGYSWDGIEENKVYNPFSVVNFFQSFKFRNYWFNTGTPTVLVRGARLEQITMEEMENLEASGNLLENANLKKFYSLSLLFQTGYLTIKKVLGVDSFLLGFPNQEVRESFASYLLAEYINKDWADMEYTIAHKLKRHLEDEQLKEAFKVFVPVIASTGYDIVKFTEGYFHTIMHVLMYSTGMTVFSELQSMQGRLDMICIGQKAIYIFEFKLDENANEALNQIKQQDYAAPYLLEKKNIYIVGVNFVSAEKKINEILVEKWNGIAFQRQEDTFTPLNA